jgi:hypothetical protein
MYLLFMIFFQNSEGGGGSVRSGFTVLRIGTGGGLW